MLRAVKRAMTSSSGKFFCKCSPPLITTSRGRTASSQGAELAWASPCRRPAMPDQPRRPRHAPDSFPARRPDHPPRSRWRPPRHAQGQCRIIGARHFISAGGHNTSTTKPPGGGRNRRAANAAPECRRQRPPPKCCSSAATAKWLAAAKVRPRAVAPSRPRLRRHLRIGVRQNQRLQTVHALAAQGAHQIIGAECRAVIPPNKLRRGNFAPAWHCPTHPAQPTHRCCPTPPPAASGPAPARPAHRARTRAHDDHHNQKAIPRRHAPQRRRPHRTSAHREWRPPTRCTWSKTTPPPRRHD